MTLAQWQLALQHGDWKRVAQILDEHELQVIEAPDGPSP